MFPIWGTALTHLPPSCWQVFEEEAEFRAGIDDTRGKRKAANSSVVQHTQATQLAQVEQQAAQKLQTAALAYVCCLQQLLQVRLGVSLAWCPGF
jgi:hypothetical protein